MSSALTDILRSVIEERTPHNRTLRMQLMTAGPEDATCMLPHAEALTGNPSSRTVHSGVITALLDVTSGAAVCVRLGRLQRMATLGLRVDFLRPASSGQHLVARAHCYEIIGSTAFVRSFAYDDNTIEPVAASQGTFALTDN